MAGFVDYRGMVVALLATIATGADAGLAQPPGARATPPIWTEAPVKIDRQHQSYQRIDAAPAATSASGTGQPSRADAFPMRFAANTRFRIIDSISFADGDTTYRLADLEPVASSRVCRNKDGERWACGVRARAALGGLLSGRPVRCAERGKANDAVLVECRRGSNDIAELLASAGHAVIAGGSSRYRDAVDEANKEKAGIWGDLTPAN